MESARLSRSGRKMLSKRERCIGGSFLSRNGLRLHVGLARAAAVDEFTVRSPSGTGESSRGANAGSEVMLREGDGAATLQGP